MKINKPIKLELESTSICISIKIPVDVDMVKCKAIYQFWLCEKYKIDVDHTENEGLTFMGNPVPSWMNGGKEWKENFKKLTGKCIDDIIDKATKDVITIDKVREFVEKEYGKEASKNIIWEFNN